MITSRFFRDDTEFLVEKREEEGFYNIQIRDKVFFNIPLRDMIDALDSPLKQGTNEVFDANTYEWMPF